MGIKEAYQLALWLQRFDWIVVSIALQNGGYIKEIGDIVRGYIVQAVKPGTTQEIRIAEFILFDELKKLIGESVE